MEKQSHFPFFAPQLFIPSGVRDTVFYQEAFGAIEHGRWTSDDGSLHVAELSIGGALFHLHEENADKAQLTPGRAGGITTLVGLFVEDVDSVMARALAAGAKLVSAARDYDYHYRQGEIEDPFGHRWLIEAKTGS